MEFNRILSIQILTRPRLYSVNIGIRRGVGVKR